MDVRRIAAALAIPCACLPAAPALCQPNPVYGPQEPEQVRSAATPAPAPDAPRMPIVEEPRQPNSATMLEAWSLGGNAQFGIGRFRVGEVARPRTNTERMPATPLYREDRAIAGAGLSLRF